MNTLRDPAEAGTQSCSYSVFQVSENLPIGSLIRSLKIKYSPSFKDVREDALEYNLHVIAAGPKKSLFYIQLIMCCYFWTSKNSKHQTGEKVNSKILLIKNT